MKRTGCCCLLPSLFGALLVLFSCRESFVSAQGSATGTVQTALLDYMLKNSASAPPPPPGGSSSSSFSSSSNTQQQQQQTSNSASTSSGSAASNPFDLYNQLMQSAPPPPQQVSNPTFTSSSTSTSTGGGSSGPSYLDMLNKMVAGPSPQQTQPQAQPASAFSGGLSSSSFSDLMNSSSSLSGGLGAASSSAGASNPMTLYSKMLQLSGSSSQGGSHPPLKMPYFDPFPTTPAPVTFEPPPKYIPFVPPEWNLTSTHTHTRQSSWGSGVQQATNSWGHHALPPVHPAWDHPRPRPVHKPIPQQPHPMSQMMMIPRVRDMINKQAVQFGDLAFYQAHGCIDPTPTRPGPGGIRPTQTLWYGCQSRVSQMVCMRAAKTAGGKSGMMSMMMSMMNPAMTRTLEKCISPRMMNQMMFQGFSGGMGGMNPMAMMAMNAGGGGGGGGGGMAGMMPMLLMMMNRQNQAAAAGGGGAGTTSNAVPSSFGSSSGKQIYGDPSRANTLISQAARVPHGAAQPQPQSSGSSMMNPLGSMLGMGGAQTSPSSGMPSGSGSSSGQVDCSALMPLMMSRVMAAGEGMNSPEAAEAIAELRKQYLPYSCQEMRLKYTGLPLRLCCPGRVDPPTIFDLFKAKNTGA